MIFSSILAGFLCPSTTFSFGIGSTFPFSRGAFAKDVSRSSSFSSLSLCLSSSASLSFSSYSFCFCRLQTTLQSTSRESFGGSNFAGKAYLTKLSCWGAPGAGRDLGFGKLKNSPDSTDSGSIGRGRSFSRKCIRWVYSSRWRERPSSFDICILSISSFSAQVD